jgi:hypothetical protein
VRKIPPAILLGLLSLAASTGAEEEAPQESRRVLLVCPLRKFKIATVASRGLAVDSITGKKVRHSSAPSIPPGSAAGPRPRRPRRTSGEPRRGLRVRLRPALAQRRDLSDRESEIDVEDQEPQPDPDPFLATGKQTSGDRVISVAA